MRSNKEKDVNNRLQIDSRKTVQKSILESATYKNEPIEHHKKTKTVLTLCYLRKHIPEDYSLRSLH